MRDENWIREELGGGAQGEYDQNTLHACMKSRKGIHFKNEKKVFIVLYVVFMYLISLEFVSTYGTMVRGSLFNYINKTYVCPVKLGSELHVKETFFHPDCAAAQLSPARDTCLLKSGYRLLCALLPPPPLSSLPRLNHHSPWRSISPFGFSPFLPECLKNYSFFICLHKTERQRMKTSLNIHKIRSSQNLVEIALEHLRGPHPL